MDRESESPRAELLAATDEQIEDAADHADPMALRGLLYQLTGDESVAATKVGPVPGYVGGNLSVGLTDPADIALLRAKAADFLKACRDSGAGQIDPGPRERLPRSLALAGGLDELPAEDVDLWVEELGLDPWVRGLTWKEPTPPERLADFSVIVIGTGMGGLNAAVQLQHAGIRFTVIEKNSGVGGTWHENRYPGARVDSPSRAYMHMIGVEFDCPSPWCSQSENQRYFDWVADTFNLREHIVFDTEVTTVVWQEGTSTWEVTAKGPEGERVFRANAVISAVGLLSRPSVPTIAGAQDFQGPSFHTARWPDGLELGDKRVGVIGTGCSGVQMVPELAKLASHVTVFQRTPQWLFEHAGYLSPFPDQVTWLDRNFPYHPHFMRFRTNWLLGPYQSGPLREIDPEFDDPFARSAVNKEIRDERVAFIRQKLASRPDLVEKMIPPHPPFSARPVQVDANYNMYDAIMRDNVALVTEGIDRITPTGIRTADGTEHELDVIVYATGFKANECLWPMEVLGRNGRSVHELWAKDGPRAYLGAMLPGFPNLFLIYGPNMNPYGGLGVVNHQEMVTRWLLECIEKVIVEEKASIDVTEKAYWRYNDQLDEREKYKIYKDARANSYYRNEHGRSVTNCPFPGNEMWHRLRHPGFDDLILR
ncbi:MULTISPECIES: NAD(P)/FAD-dependent oxidoreductase [unclassified Parafrankia]|uniref:flavin-containing monooxygenase n=1 Tax=unclassified Parafrankia TaxID=2994368 RepID=UPI000DA51F16|nr:MULTISPECIES: NAD(P)/FAD-dependent oxidoreductase [unclassified Parafrankia]TCJ32677.1 NAD(P)/FAD-dependent oxidoreductase [Parafrankia sp. BMG5.11]SQD94874.1 Flavin-containing monooxygenase-like protein [Parafrankia sp. Ea1.12]